MVDAFESKAKGPAHYPLHPCLHIRHKVAQNANAIAWTDWNHVVEKVHRDFTPWWIDTCYQWPPEDALAGPAGEAFNEFSSQIPTDVSIANFLYELKDLKGIIPNLRDGLAKGLNNGYLSWNFGIKPMLSDIGKLRNVVENVQKRLDWLRRNYGKPVKINFARNNIWQHPNLNEFPDIADVATLFLPPGQWSVLESYRADFKASGILTQRLIGLDDSLAVLKSLAAALGLNNPTAIVWEAIPYSFVVDWFFRLDDWIDQLAISPFKGTWDINGVTHSIKIQAKVGLWYRGNQPFAPAQQNPWVKLYTVDVTGYQRMLGLPVKRSALSALTPDQQKLLGSLIIQRII